MSLAVFDDGPSRLRADMWQRLQLLNIGSIDRQHLWRQIRYHLPVGHGGRLRHRNSSAYDVEVLELVVIEMIQDGDRCTHQQRAAQKQDRHRLLTIEIDQDSPRGVERYLKVSVPDMRSSRTFRVFSEMLLRSFSMRMTPSPRNVWLKL